MVLTKRSAASGDDNEGPVASTSFPGCGKVREPGNEVAAAYLTRDFCTARVHTDRNGLAYTFILLDRNNYKRSVQFH